MAALNGAVPFVEVNQIAMLVAQQLNFDMSRLLDELFDKNIGGTESRHRFTLGLFEQTGRSSGLSTTRMPRPPPPLAAFKMTGYPVASASFFPSATSAIGLELPPSTGTPAARAISRAVILFPRDSRTFTEGPTKTIPASSQAAASAGFSERNPYPG